LRQAAIGDLSARQKQELDRIVAITHPQNLASQRVLEKCGLTRNRSGAFYGHECFFFEIDRPTSS
jgi:RimJ/RimL family protein N-acetyltransferase